MHKRFYSLSTAVALLGLIAGCSDRSPASPPPTTTTDVLSITITPKGDSVLVGATRTFQSRVVNQFGAERAVNVSWSSTDPSIASIAGDGTVTGLAAGSTQIVAGVGASADTANLLVRPLVSNITVLPNAAQVVLGDSLRFVADMGAAGTGANLQAIRPEWSTSDSSVAYVREDGQLVTLAAGDVEITVNVAGVTAVASARVFRAPIAAVNVTPAVATIAPGQSVQLNALAITVFGRPDPTEPISWSSSDPSVATVTAAGQVTAIARGFAVISASAGNRTGRATVTVGPKPVQQVVVSLQAATIGEGERTVATALVQDADGVLIQGASLAWQSGNPSIATVDASGNVVAVAEGNTSVSAISGGRVGTAPLRVTRRTASTLRFSPAAPVLTVGAQSQVLVEVIDQNGSVMPGAATLASLNPGVASINQSGIVTGLSAGTATLRATFNSLTATATATVGNVAVASVSISPATLNLIPGNRGSFAAVVRDASGAVLSNRAVAWSSANPAVASVNGTGEVTANSMGSVLISASSEGKSASALVSVAAAPSLPVASVSVTLNSAALNIGESTQAVAVAKDANGAVLLGRTVSWSSSDVDLATVSGTGMVTAGSAGTVTIMATIGGQSGVAALNVNTPAPAAVAFFNLRLNTHSLAPGGTTQAIVIMRDAAGNDVTGTVGFSSTYPAIARVNASGIITGVSAGDAEVFASTPGFSDQELVAVTAGAAASPVLTSITVSATSATVQVGNTLQLTASPRDQNGAPITTGSLAWTSSNTSIATVNSTGLVTARASGGVTISAATSGVTGTMAVTVSSSPPPAPAPVAAITVSLSPTSVPVGQASLVSAVLKDAQGNTLSGRTILYSSSNTAVATVATNGVITALTAGSATISAISEGKTGSAALTVTAPTAPPPPPPSSGGPAALATLPLVYLNTTYVPPTGKTINVNAGGDLQAAINSANRGDVIMLQPGAVFTGSFVLPNKPGTGWITIRSAAPDANLPAPGQRMTPAFASQLPKLHVPYANGVVINTAPGASFYRLMFLEITSPSSISQVNSLVRLGDPNANHNVTPIATDLIIDRSYIHGSATLQLVRCVMLSSARTSVVDSYLSDCHANGFDSQAIVGWNGPGPYKINNNYLQGAGEIVMFGGATPNTPGMIPSDIEMRGNHLHKPASWKSLSWSIKNLFELKFARRVLFEGNILDGNWQQAQTGYAINIKSSADFSWGVTEHVTLRNNIIRNTGAGIVIFAYEGATRLPANHITIANNIIENVNTGIYTGSAVLLTMLGDVRDVSITHNTMVTSGNMNSAVTFEGAPSQRLTFSNNILTRGQYGVKGSGSAEGTATLTSYSPALEFVNNVFVGSTANPYPASTRFASSLSAIGFVNISSGDYTLTSGSPYKGLGSSGRDPGADVALIRSSTAGVLVP